VQVKLGYADRTRTESTRVVHPLGLVDKGSTWYLIANTDKGLRTFRLNRVRSVELTKDPVDRPEGFDLAEAWQSVVDHVEERRNEFRAGATAVVRVSRRGVEGLKYAFGSTVRVLGAVAGQSDLFDVEVGSRHPAYIAERLAGWAHAIDVLDTEENVEVRKHLADIGRTLVERYAGE
jgi:predicted DNA-binding transcriptional regulator YafY